VVPRATADKKRGRWPPRRADQSSNGTPPLTELLRSVPIRARCDSRRAQAWGHSQRAARLGAAQEERVRVRWCGATASGRAAGPARGKTEEGARKGRSLTRGAARSERARERERAREQGGRRRQAGPVGSERKESGESARVLAGCWAARPTRGKGKRGVAARLRSEKERGKRWAAREGSAQELLLPSFASSFSFSFPTLNYSNNSI
jgi:hypothetical protein